MLFSRYWFHVSDIPPPFNPLVSPPSRQCSCTHLPAAISTINQQISTSSIRRSIRAEINISALQLLRISVAAHRNHAHPEILCLLGHEVGKAGIDIARRDGVDTSEVTPFIRKRLGHVDASGLSDVV